MKNFRPLLRLNLQKKICTFSFTLLGEQLTAVQSLEFLEETAAQNRDVWAYSKDGGTVRIHWGNGSITELLADVYEIHSSEIHPLRLFDWMPPSIVRDVMANGDIPIILDDNGKIISYFSLKEEANRV